MLNSNFYRGEIPVGRQKPLASAIRLLLVSGLVVGGGVVPVWADPTHLPVGSNVTTIGTDLPVTTLGQGEAANLNASNGSAIESLSGHTLTINPSNNAIINWNSFNIDKGYNVNFVQPGSSSVVLNNIGDSNASQIFGTLTANGEVFLVNANGFVFGSHSSVNVNSLVASTLGISQADLISGISNVFNNAYSSNPSTAVAQGAALQGNGQMYMQDSQSHYLLDSSGNKIPISINVDAGANLHSFANGGLMLLAAPNINNKGTITAPDGQVILAGATDKVYLQDSTDANLRGMLVEVGTGGTVTNTGTVLATTGNASLIGFAVNQSGIVSASTSVALNGSVRLMAEEGIQNPSTTAVQGELLGASTTRTATQAASIATTEGIPVSAVPTQATVTLNSNSVTSVTLDSSNATALTAQSQPKSLVEISGHNVNLLNGSQVVAHAGIVNIVADEIPLGLSYGAVTPADQGTGRIYMASGSSVDVSGIQNVSVPVADNVVSIKLQSNELSNSPLQRTGVLYGQTVYVDIRNATFSYDSSGNLIATVPIANVTGSVQTIASNIEQRSTAGGGINLSSTGDVIVNNGSTLNFSGGSVAYQGGIVPTTQLISGSQTYNINTASPNLTYNGLYNQNVYQAGYMQGAAGGSLNITSYAALLDGNLQGHTTNGALQRLESQWAAASTLDINLLSGNPLIQQDIVFSNTSSGLNLGPNDALPLLNSNSATPVALNINAGMLSKSGIKNISLSSNGSMTIDANTQLDLPAAGQFNVTASSFDVQGSIIAPGGAVNLAVSPSGLANSVAKGGINLGTAAVIDVSGVWVNDWLDNMQGQALSAVAINAGSVKLSTAGGDLLLQSGSQILADSGAWKTVNGSITAGSAGSISLDASTLGASLKLGGELSAWGMQKDGSLTLKANQLLIGDATPTTATELVLSPHFFQQSGFSSFNLVSSVQGLTVADNVQLNLQQQNLQLTSLAALAHSGSHLTNLGQILQLPDYVRKADSLTMSYTGTYYQQNVEQSLSIGQGALIQTDPGGSVVLNSDTSIFVDGTINTPGGNIGVNITLPPYATSDLGYVASQGIWLGSASQLLAQGVFTPQASAIGLVTGNVLAGGNVSLTANRGYIVSESGAQIDVSGISAQVQSSQQNGSNGIVNLTQTIPSSAGSISLVSGEGIVVDGTLNAHAGGSGAAGGNLSVVLDSTLLNPPAQPTSSQTPFPSVPSTIVLNSGIKNVGLTEGANVPSSYAGQAILKTSVLNSAGLGSIDLKTDAQLTAGQLSSAIVFEGNVVELAAGRQIILDSPTLQTADSNAKITINAPYVALGSSQVNQKSQGYALAPAAVTGTGQFNVVNAQGIDLIGGLNFNGFNQVNLTSHGDLRMIGDIDANFNTKNYLGELNLAGNLDITAQRVYPATLTAYTFNVSNTATFNANGSNSSEILSAGGSLTVNASDIVQNGNVQAPFGAIDLIAANTLTLGVGSTTSVSGLGSVVPFGIGSSSSWLYPLDSSGNHNVVIYDQTTNNLPQKSLALNANTVNLQTGASIDLRGGGDLYAYEFVSGSGGSADVLNSNQQYAVLPGVNNILTPYDPQQYSASGLSMGENVYLNAASGLAAGWYTLLPAHYALLPGAYLVTPEAGTAGQYQTTYNAAGDAIVSGYYGVAGTSIQNAVPQGFEVQPGSIFTGSVSSTTAGTVVNTNSATPAQFNAYLASTAIKSLAEQYGNVVPQLPQDAGSLLLAATNNLTLDANLQAAPAGTGLGGQVDISGNNLQVVGSSTDLSSLPSGSVGLLASQLNSFNAPSLLLGGKRSLTASGELLTITANNVTVSADAALKGSEILLAASNQVTVASGAQVLSTTTSSGLAGGTLILENNNGGSDGALLRVSSAGQVTVDRDLPISGTGGLLSIGLDTNSQPTGSGAYLQASGSMLLDSSQNTIFHGVINQSGGTLGALALNSSSISIGEAPAKTAGLVLSAVPSNVDSLSFNSSGDFNLYGKVDFKSTNVSISAAAINGFNVADPTTGKIAGQIATITATKQLELANNGASSVQSGTGSGTLVLNAQNILLGSGQYAINGFQNVQLNATQAIDGLGAAVAATTSSSANNGSLGNTNSSAPGVLTVGGDITLNTTHISGGNGATSTINAGNHQVTLAASGVDSSTLATGLGVSWSISGGVISSNASFDLPSGILNLTATSGDINLNSGSSINLSGRTVDFSGTSQYSAGGNLSLVSNLGNVNLATGSTVNLAGYVASSNGVKQQFSNAGSLNVQAANGLFNWDGKIDATAGAVSAASGVQSGNIQLNVSSLGGGDFSALNSKLASAGFGHNLNLTQQKGDISIAATDVVNASQFQLSAEQGAVNIGGEINVSGASAGTVSIYGENGISLLSTGKIYAMASGAGNAGGSVTLDTVHQTDTGSGLLDLSATGGVINVSGGSNGAGGSVLLRTGRDDTTDSVNVTAINTKISGVGSLGTVLEATRVYRDINAGTANADTITAANIATWQHDTANFMNNAPQTVNTSGSVLLLMPGIEVQSSGNLTLASTWDFMSGGTGWSSATSSWNSGWRYGAEQLPGYLTLRAADDLNINASLSDAVAATPVVGQASKYQQMIQPGQSWSYNLVAGGNVNLAASYQAANPLSTRNIVDTQVVVRSGTGNIGIQAGKNIEFNLDNSGQLNVNNDASAVYTVGTTALYNASQLQAGSVPGLPALPSGESLQTYLSSLSQTQLNQALRYGLLTESAVGSTYLLAEYPTNGGNIALQAGGDIQGQQTGQAIADWLVTPSSSSNAGSYAAAMWGINISSGANGSSATNHNFNQNVGALGGGNVTVQAGGNVKDLSVMIPTTGKPLGVVSNYGKHNVITWNQSTTFINGGGNLQLTAGNDIVAGEYYVAKGTANLQAGGSIAEDANNPSATTIGTILDVGDAVFKVQSRQDLVLETAMNPTILLPSLQPTGEIFFSYAADSAVNLQSVAGNVVFLNNAGSIQAMKNQNAVGNDGDPGYEFTIYPGIVSAAALAGDIRIDNSMELFPSLSGSLQLLANGNIGIDPAATLAATNGLDNSGNLLSMSNVSPALLPGSTNPAYSQAAANIINYVVSASSANGAGLTASQQLPLGSQKTALIVAKNGNIAFPNALQASINLPSAADIIAGGNISDLSIVTQNQLADDITLILAGGNINFDTTLDDNGIVQAGTNLAGITVSGPGVLQVLAGGSLNLGSSLGIATVGNQNNVALSSAGASIETLVGLTKQVDTVLPQVTSHVDYVGFVTKYQNNSLYKSALSGLTGSRGDLPVLLKVLFNEIKLSAAAAAVAPESQRYALYQQGFAALKALFPAANYSGDINMVFSQIATRAGGDISLLTPGGGIDVGLAGNQSGNQKGADQLGILIQQQGNLNVFTKGDLNVNQSRVFTEGDGNITVWSSSGSIDAGKGAKSAISASKPVTVVSPGGEISTTFPPVIAGSGIQAIGGGNVYLAAPNGVVNAGEAGISGRDIVIAAATVVGTSNISSTGTTVGVPAAVAPPVGLAGADSAAAGASKAGVQTTTTDDSNDGNGGNGKAKSAVAILTTDVVGFGQCSVGDVKNGTKGCGG